MLKKVEKLCSSGVPYIAGQLPSACLVTNCGVLMGCDGEQFCELHPGAQPSRGKGIDL